MACLGHPPAYRLYQEGWNQSGPRRLQSERNVMTVPPYHVSAFNTAKASENKIHDDATAQRFGFKGGIRLYVASARATLGPRVAGAWNR